MTRSTTELMDEYGLSEREARYVQARAAGMSSTDAYADAAPAPITRATARVHASVMGHRPHVQAAYRSLLAERDPERAAYLKMTRQKAVEDLELVKTCALEDIEASAPGRKSGGAYQALVNATMGQAQIAGLLVQRHRHEHLHGTLPTEVLIERLRRSNPLLADALAEHLSCLSAAEP